ncbi:mini-circle protein [Catellatospora methionotrophica]|uniref:Mini-circle protein n=1 Tax=Catellatospora methionotrophica TaxID=121620 RepID=A0A8J3PCF5_9ACTN|nr:DinB family protein [Catellatospora methionotrophica]GIG11957.1 mini-circle protein [Catellatospora methionotrophica]
MMHVDTVGYPEPPAVAGEAETLLGSLERQRATFAWKCAGLDAAGLRSSVGISLMTLGGLLKHMAYMEDVNFTGDLAGAELPPPWEDLERSAGPGAEWRTAASDPPAELYQLWEQAVDRSRAAVNDVLMTTGVDTVYTAPDGSLLTLRRLLVDMIEEYARHTGHADLIREAYDGRVGEDPPGPAYPYQAA